MHVSEAPDPEDDAAPAHHADGPGAGPGWVEQRGPMPPRPVRQAPRHACTTILDAVAAGRLPVEQALRSLSLMQVAQLGEFARLDLGRHARKGVPEVVYAPRKTDAALVAIMRHFVEAGGLGLASRVSAAQAELVRASFASPDACRRG